MAMIIVDSQVHVWGPETPDKPYFTENASKPHQPIPLSHKELLQEMDACGVQRTVCVPPTWEGFSNEESLRAARLHPDRFDDLDITSGESELFRQEIVFHMLRIRRAGQREHPDLHRKPKHNLCEAGP